MNPAVLIDAIVRQTMVLIAEIAMAGESRPTLARTADEVFSSLVDALRSQGASNKTIADVLGMTLRSYHKKVARLMDADQQRNRVLRNELLDYIQNEATVRKARIAAQFHREDPVLVAGLLQDLVRAELVFQSGNGPSTAYRATRDGELPPDAPTDADRLANLLWIAIFRYGPVALADLLARIPSEEDETRLALERLQSDGRVSVVSTAGGEPVYATDECVIPPEDAGGWPAAFFDHFQALVGTLAQRLRRRERAPDGRLGGATFSFEVWRGHPMFDETMDLFTEVRSRARALRERIRDWNVEHAKDVDVSSRVIFYAGQSTIGLEEDTES